ncbi:Hypothetical predicted protein [Octopus vulgaris]|uniref:Uncharacterized protein n=1 Tax=Octopus vulgaris TaxID=6645 RepID=A0AA36AUJ9_OCTVU|nr:Hypothetical predicted protein [Octopus vulgaris]
MRDTGPCGEESARAFMENSLLEKEFPKEYLQETRANADGYSYYKRRQATIQADNFTIHHRYVAPYNKYLRRKFNAPKRFRISLLYHA